MLGDEASGGFAVAVAQISERELDGTTCQRKYAKEPEVPPARHGFVRPRVEQEPADDGSG